MVHPVLDDPYGTFRIEAEIFNGLRELVERDDSIEVIKAEMKECAKHKLFEKPIDLGELSPEEWEVFRAVRDLDMLLCPVVFLRIWM